MNRQKRITVALGEHSQYKQLDDIDLRQTIRDFKQRELNRLIQSANSVNGEEYEVRIGDRILSDDSIVDQEIMQNDHVNFHKRELPLQANEEQNGNYKKFSYFKYEKMALLLFTAIEVGALLHQYKNGKINSETLLKRSGVSLGNNIMKTMQSVRTTSFKNQSIGTTLHEIIRGPRPKFIFVIGAFTIGFYAQQNMGENKDVNQEADKQNAPYPQLITPSILQQKAVQKLRTFLGQSDHKPEPQEQLPHIEPIKQDFTSPKIHFQEEQPHSLAIHQQALIKLEITDQPSNLAVPKIQPYISKK